MLHGVKDVVYPYIQDYMKQTEYDKHATYMYIYVTKCRGHRRHFWLIIMCTQDSTLDLGVAQHCA